MVVAIFSSQYVTNRFKLVWGKPSKNTRDRFLCSEGIRKVMAPTENYIPLPPARFLSLYFPRGHSTHGRDVFAFVRTRQRKR